MNDVRTLYKRLRQEQDFPLRYPEYRQDDGKVHVLYVAPCLNASGYYRMIEPAIQLNRTDTHAAIVTHIHPWDFTKTFDDYDTPVDQRLIDWAHYVVLPGLTSAIGYILRAFRRQNPSVRFVMDIDRNLHELPVMHPDYPKVHQKQKEQFLLNLSLMDIVTGASEGLLDYYQELLDIHYPDSVVRLDYLPDLPTQYRSERRETAPENTKVRIGIPLSPSCWYNILPVLNIFYRYHIQNPQGIQWVIFGWDGKLPAGEDISAPFSPQHVRPVHFLDYYHAIEQLNLDLAVLPLKNLRYNTHGKSFVQYLELSMMGIPVIASDLSPYNQIINHKENGLLAGSPQEWLEALDLLVNDNQYRHLLGRNAQRNTYRYYTYNSDNRWLLQDTFTP